MTVKTVHNSPSLNTFETYVSCEDCLVSGEKFDLLLDDQLDMLVTSPKPATEDLGKYYDSNAYISHTDSKKSALDFIYQTVKKKAIKRKLKLINSFGSKEKRILDIGAGTGDFLKACALDGWDVIAVEPNDSARQFMEIKLNNGAGFLHKSMSNLLEEDRFFSSFDVITLWHVLEHMPNLDETIFNLKKLLKPEGTIVVAVPNYKSFDAAYYKNFWAAYDVPRHLWHFSQTAIRRLFFFQGMEVVKTLPMKYDSFYVSLLSEKQKTNKMNFLRAFWIGLRSNWKAIKSKEYSSLTYTIKNT